MSRNDQIAERLIDKVWEPHVRIRCDESGCAVFSLASRAAPPSPPVSAAHEALSGESRQSSRQRGAMIALRADRALMLSASPASGKAPAFHPPRARVMWEAPADTPLCPLEAPENDQLTKRRETAGGVAEARCEPVDDHTHSLCPFGIEILRHRVRTPIVEKGTP